MAASPAARCATPKGSARGLLHHPVGRYLYFWRWALWRLFEQQDCGGIVTFITASSYLGGPGFIGMREHMRREFDELYIVNLGGDLLGTRKTPNVFNIQTPVAIAIGFRRKEASKDKPATVYYCRIEASTRADKLAQLDSVYSLSSLKWEKVKDSWSDPFYPRVNAGFFQWPELSNLFPWQHSGSQFKRVWPIAETEDVLADRWRALLAAKENERKRLFKESRDRKISKSYRSFSSAELPSIASLDSGATAPSISRYAYRQFDRQYALVDNRLGDYLRAPLVDARGQQNVFFCTLITKYLGDGAALGVSADLPDLDVFCGRGGKDIMPLYRDAAATEPNVTAGLLDKLSESYGAVPSAEDFAAYVHAVLGGRSYTSRFWNELETPGPRVPLTKDRQTFAAAAALGRRLIWLHTYAERFQGEGRGSDVSIGTAKNINAVSPGQASYPEDYAYDPEKREIRVGDGIFGPVESEVWEFEVSGLKVVQSWLGYRMKKRAGRKSSPLDDIRPESWTPRLTDEFLELLWVLEATLAMEPDLSTILDKIVSEPCFKADELPIPTAEERKPPQAATENDDQLSMFDDDSEAGDEE